MDKSVMGARMRCSGSKKVTSRIRTNRDTQDRDDLLPGETITSFPHFKYPWDCVRTYTKRPMRVNGKIDRDHPFSPAGGCSENKKQAACSAACIMTILTLPLGND
jgi:hypothetical protein